MSSSIILCSLLHIHVTSEFSRDSAYNYGLEIISTS